MSDPGLSAIDLLWRESLHRSGPVPDAFELRDWASRLGAHGAVLRDCATLVEGLSPPPADRAAAADAAEAWTVDIARAELLALARTHALSLHPAAAPQASGRPDNPLGIGPGIPARDPPADLATLAARLVALLGSDDPDLPALADALADALELARRLPTFDYRQYAQADPARLAGAIATASLSAFALDVAELALPPFGSPRLFWQAARLDRHGLGPWFRGVPTVVRAVDDLFDLARMAAPPGDLDGFGAWVALLSRHLPDWMFRHLADDLADHGRSAALGALLARALARRPDLIHLSTIAYLRDAALDIGALDIAGRAQAVVAAVRPDAVIEQEILSSIHAGAGDLVQARAVLLGALRTVPDHPGLLSRLETLGTPAFAEHSVRRGYGSPPDRADTRRAARGDLPGNRGRKGQRMTAVEV